MLQKVLSLVFGPFYVGDFYTSDIDGKNQTNSCWDEDFEYETAQ